MNNQQTDQATVDREIRTVCELTGSTNITLNDTGWDSRVYSVDNGRYFFKFPRSDKIKSKYTQEIQALGIAAELGVVNIPQVKWRHPHNDYFGYEGVPGLLLNDVVSSLDTTTKRQIGEQIGHFLRKFHARTFPGVRIRSVEDEIAQFQQFYEPAVSTIGQVYSPAEQRALRTLVYETWPERIRSLGSNEVLSHGDLHLSNMLFDTKHGLGIIDFGDIARYDESRDLIDLEDISIEQAALEAYGTSALLRQKIAARKPTLELISLTYHLQKGHTDDAKRYLEKLRSYL